MSLIVGVSVAAATCLASRCSTRMATMTYDGSWLPKRGATRGSVRVGSFRNGWGTDIVGLLGGPLALLVVIVAGCAGHDVVRPGNQAHFDRSSRYVAFAFRDPSSSGLMFPGVGSRFTHAFVNAAAEFGRNIVPVFTADFGSASDINLPDAIKYARRERFDYLITGEVTKWVDRATEWSAKRDFAGLSVAVRSVKGGAVAASTVIEQHSERLHSEPRGSRSAELFSGR